MPPSRHSAHPATHPHHPHPNQRELHHGPPSGGPPPPGAPMHPHSAYAQAMPPPNLPPHTLNGLAPGPGSGAGNPSANVPPRMMMMSDGGPGANAPPPPPPPPHIARSSSTSSHIMEMSAPNAGPSASSAALSASQKLAMANEQAWISIRSTAEAMEDFERALSAYENALRHNPYSVPALNAIAGVHRTLDNFEKAVEYFQRVLNIVPENGDVWGSMGHCYLMMDDLQRAYTAYQQALYHLPNPKEPKLWYGIGILYDRYGSLEHAEEAFASVVRMDPNYEKANEIYFRLGIIYKQQNKFQASLECFRYILTNPPRPLTEIDIWFQIGHVYEQQKDFALAKEAYERVLAENPTHAKVLQQLGWLYHQSNAGFTNQERAIQFLTKSLESDPNDAQSWYLLGRAYMAGQNYNKAYEAYQQAVYRDGKNPTFWCSIGVLYYQINQFRDALDAYSRAIRLNPYISEVWFDLGSLYESCNNQISDAIDAYQRAAELDPDNPQIQQRLALLRNAEAKGEQVPSAPMPQDVHPTAYANNNGMPPGPPAQIGGPPPSSSLYSLAPHGGGPAAAAGDRDLPAPGHLPPNHSPPPFRGAPPPIPNIDERGTRPSNHAQLAPMNTSDPHHRGFHPHSRGPSPGAGAGPAPRLDPYGRGMGSPRHSPPPPLAVTLRPDMHEGGGPDYRGGPPPPGGGPPVDQHGRTLPVAMSDREREMEWERERAARQYPGSGRVTPKNDPGYPRSQHGGSNGPSPAFSRPPVYPRDDPRDFYNGGYERGGGGPRMEEGRPPYDYDRSHGGGPPPGARYDPMADHAEGPRPTGADVNGPATEQRERMRAEYSAVGPLADGAADGLGAGRGKPRRGPKAKEELETLQVAGSPAGSTAGSKKRKDGASSRASSPWTGKPGSAKNGTAMRADSKGPPSVAGSKKLVAAQWRGKDGASVSGSRPSSPAGVPHVRSLSQAETMASLPERAVSPASSTGSNEPLAARGPSRVVDEDYDEGAADALMGLAGAASASASMPPYQSLRGQSPPPPAPGSTHSRRPNSGHADEGSRSNDEPNDAHKYGDMERMSPSRNRPESSLGKRPFHDEDRSPLGFDESSKRVKNSSPSGSTATNGRAAGGQGEEQDAREATNGSRASPTKARAGDVQDRLEDRPLSSRGGDAGGSVSPRKEDRYLPKTDGTAGSDAQTHDSMDVDETPKKDDGKVVGTSLVDERKSSTDSNPKTPSSRESDQVDTDNQTNGVAPFDQADDDGSREEEEGQITENGDSKTDEKEGAKDSSGDTGDKMATEGEPGSGSGSGDQAPTTANGSN